MENRNLTHWKALTNPDYLGAYAFEPGEVKTVTIKNVTQDIVQNQTGSKEQCTVIHFVEDVKPLILNKTNAKTISNLYGTPYIEEWGGLRVNLNVKKVSAFGEIVDAVRVMNEKPAESVTICENCGKPVTPGGGRSASELLAMSKSHFGKAFCLDCMKNIKATKEEE